MNDPKEPPKEFFDEISERMVVVSKRSWIAVGMLLFLAAAILIWAFFGSISVYVLGRGISLSSGGIYNVTTNVDGQVEELRARSGDSVNTGDILAVVKDMELEVKIENAEERVESLKMDLENARELAEKEEKQTDEALDEAVKALSFALERRQNQIPFLHKDLESKRRLYQEGLISAALLEQAERALMEERIKIEDLKVEMEKTIAERDRGYKTDQLITYERLYRDAVSELEQLRARDQFLEIKSPVSGFVIEVQTNTNHLIKKGSTVALVEKKGEGSNNLLFFCYVLPEEGQKVKKGMNVKLELNQIDPQKFGAILGRVERVSRYPVSFLSIFNIIPNEEVARYLTDNRPAVIEVVVKPLKDPDTPSGFAWTSEEGPDLQLHSGYLCEMKAIVETRRPISYLFPQWWVPGL